MQLQRNPRGSSITEVMIDVDLFLDFLDAWNPLGCRVEIARRDHLADHKGGETSHAIR
jgi:hypothetical protein